MRNRPGRYYTKCSPDCVPPSSQVTNEFQRFAPQCSQATNEFQRFAPQVTRSIEKMIPNQKITQVLASNNYDLDENYNTESYKNRVTINFLWNRPTSRGGTNMSVWGHKLSDAERETIFIPIFCAFFFVTMSPDPHHWLNYIEKGVMTIIKSVLNDPANVKKELTMRRVLEFTC